MSGIAPWADPRGAYAILALLALAVFGATLAPGGLRNRARGRRRIVAAAVLVGASLSLVWPQLTRSRALDEYPLVEGVGMIAGTWRDGTDTLVLAADGTYECRGARCAGFATKGTWALESNGTLAARSNDGRTVPWRVVRYNGRLRLGIFPSDGTGASWESHLLYERIDP